MSPETVTHGNACPAEGKFVDTMAAFAAAYEERNEE
jgi:hypothetical protein